MKKKAQVIMLPSKKQEYQVQQGQTFINDSRRDSWGALEALNCERVTNHGHAWSGSGIGTDINHLYIVTDDEIKEGDWCLFFWDGTKDGELGQIGSEPQRYFPENGHTLNRNLRKIIATTDVDMCDPKNGAKDYTYRQFPQPSKAFIKKYCEVGGIDEVNVEYEMIMGDAGIIAHTFGEDEYRLKVNTHNEITIHPIKDSWSREEVEQHIRDCSSDIISKYLRDLSFDLAKERVEEWIKKNL